MRWIGQLLKCEVAHLCSDSSASILLDKSNDALRDFNWKSVLDEIAANALLLFTCFQEGGIM